MALIVHLAGGSGITGGGGPGGIDGVSCYSRRGCARWDRVLPGGGGPVLSSCAVQEIPDEYGVVVRARHDLKLVELQPEDSARMLDEGAHAECARGGAGVQGGGEVPNLDLAVVSARDDPLGVEPDAPDELLVTLQDPQAGAALDVPQPDRVVARAGDHEAVVVLQAGDAPLVPIQRPNKLAGTRVPDLDGPVARGGYDVLLVKVDDVDRGSVADEHAAQVDLGGRDHVPHGDRPVLGAGHHHAVVEPQVEHGLAVVDQRVHHLTR